MKRILLTLFCISFFLVSRAQTTEDFESLSQDDVAFTSNSVLFNVTGGILDVETGFPGTGWNGTMVDDKYLDNEGTFVYDEVVGSIETDAGTDFYIKSFWIYVGNTSADNSAVPNASLTVNGYLDGSGTPEFSVTKNSGFETGATNNGFTFFDFSTEGSTDNSLTAIDRLEIVVNDGTGDANSSGEIRYLAIDAFTWDLIPSNTAPTISLDAAILAYTENDPATQIDAAGTVNDADGDADWDGGTLEVQITANNEAADEISIDDQDADGITITISTTDILANATDVGDLSTSGGVVTDGTALTITFDADATNAIVQEVLQSIRYRNTSDNPGTLNRTVTITATDTNSDFDSDTRTISVAAVNDPPVIGNLDTDAFNYTEGDGVAVLDQGTAATISDAENPADLDGGNVTVNISAGEVASEDLLTFDSNVDFGIGPNDNVRVNDGGLITIGTLGNAITPGNDLVVNLNANATLSRVELLLASLAYQNLGGNDPTAGLRTVSVTVDDGDGSGQSSAADINVTVLAVNNEPTLAGDADDPTFSAGGSPVGIFSNAATSTVEAGQSITDFVIEITNVNDGTPQGSDEILNVDGTDIALNDGNNDSGTPTSGNSLDYTVSITGSTATVSLSNGTLTEGQMNTIIDGITYDNNEASPSLASRVISITSLTDDGGTTNGGDDTNTSLAIASSTVSIDGPPLITDVEWLDQNEDGDIDGMTLTFSEAVDFTDTDGAGGTGLDILTVSGGIIIDPAPNYGDGTFDNITTATLSFTNTITGTGLPGNTITYTSGATNATIVETGGGAEVVDGEVGANGGTYTDGAAPVITAAETDDSDENGFIDAVILTFSENLDDDNGAGDLSQFDIGTTTYTNETADTNNDDDNQLTISFDELIAPNYDTDATPSVDMPAGTVADASGNTLGATQNFGNAADAAEPVIVNATFYDTNTDGDIDEVVILFSEDIDDTDFNVNDFSINAATPTLSALDNNQDAITDGANDDILILDVSITGTATPGDTDFTNGGGNYLGQDGLAVIDQVSITEIDAAAPVVVSATMAATNAYLEVVYSEDVRASTDPTDPILPSDFNTSFTDGGTSGNITSLSTSDITDNSDVTLSGAATAVRFVLSAGGTPDSDDDAVITPLASTVQDVAGNDLDVAEVATAAFNNVTAVVFTGFTIQNDNSYVTVTVSEDVDRQSGGGTNPIRFPQEVNFGSFTDPDNSMGAASFSVTAIQDNAGNALGSGGYDTFRFLLDLDGGTASGDETFRIFPTSGAQVYATSGGVAMSATEFIEITLADQAPPVFQSVTLNSGATTVVGGDALEFGGPEQATITVDWDEPGLTVTGDFTDILGLYSANESFTDIGGGLYEFTLFPAQFLNNGTRSFDITATDASVNSNSATESALTIEIDSEAPTTTIDNDLFTANDNSAGNPITVSGTTDDDNVILELTIDNTGSSEDTFTSGVSTGFAAPSGGIWSINLGKTGDGGANDGDYAEGTYDITLKAIDDEGNESVLTETDILTIDSSDPLITISAQSVVGQDASVQVQLNEIGDIYYLIEADGTGSDANTVRTTGTQLTIDQVGVDFDIDEVLAAVTTDYDLRIVAEDQTGNLSAVTNVDLTSGGVTITAPSNNICIDAESVTIGNIVITEFINNDFRQGSNQTLTIGLPDDFSFNTGVLPTITPTGTGFTINSRSFIGDGTLRINYSLTAGSESASNSLTISGLEVTATGSPLAGQTIGRVGGTATVFGLAVDDGVVLGTLSSTDRPAQPIMNFGGNPAGDIAFEPNEAFTFNATGGAVSYRWYDEGENVSAETTANFDQTDFNAFTGYDNSVIGVYPITVTTVDALGCESDGYETQIGIMDISIPKTTFAEGEAAATITAAIPAANLYPGAGEYEPSFTGAGLGPITDGGAGNNATIDFTPAAAGTAGSPHTILYQLSNGSRTFTTGLDLTVVGGSGGSGAFSNTVSLDLFSGETGTIMDVETVSGFYFYELTFTPDAAVGNLFSPPGYSAPTPPTPITGDLLLNGWQFDAPTVTVPEQTVIDVWFVPNNDASTTDNALILDSETFTVYPLPQIALQEDYDGNIYCEDGGSIDINYGVRNYTNLTTIVNATGFTASGFTVDRITGTSATTVVGGGTIDFANLLGNPTVGLQAGREFETYEITFDSQPTDDPSPANGTNSFTFTITVFATPDKPTLQTSASQQISNTPPNPVYFYEYCEGSTIENLQPVVPAGNTIRWYEGDNLGPNSEIITASANNMGAFNLFGQTNPDPGTYYFYFTQTDYAGDFAGFTGCESDYSQVIISVYPEVGNPLIDPTFNTKGEDLSAGSDGTYYVYEYCVGETIEDIALWSDYALEDFSAGLPTNWTIGGGSTVSGGELVIANPGGDVETDFYQAIQKISFRYRSTGGTANADFALYDNTLSEITETTTSLSTSSATYTDFEVTYVGSFNDVYIVIEHTGGGSNFIIDDFEVESTLPNVSFYQWDDDNNLDGDFDGELDGSDDGSGQGLITSEGNYYATGAELMNFYGLTDTPPAGRYSFFVNRVENINGTAFLGCQGDVTQIDIVVHDIPSAPTGFTTDINAHSGELSINDRILAADLLETPGMANIDYIWSTEENTLGATDTINFSTGTNNNPDISYADLFTSLGTSGLTTNGGGYYEVNSTVSETVYLFQVTNDLNREVSFFPGCGSTSGTPLNITIYPLAEAPILSDLETPQNDYETAGVGDDLELNFCAGELTSTDLFEVASNFTNTGLNTTEFNWYRSDGAGSKLLPISVTSSSDASSATASELFLTGINNDVTSYYLVSQTTDIEGSTYKGGESDSVRLKVNIYNIPDAPDADYVNDSTEFYYCFGDPIRSLKVADSDPDDPVDFFWYATEADALAGTNRLTVANDAEIQPAEMVPDENTIPNLAGTPSVGTYTFYATQVTNANPPMDFGGPAFSGCESEPIEFTIYVRGIPVDPILDDDLLRFCEGDDAPEFEVNNRVTGGIITWYEDDQSTIVQTGTNNAFDPDDIGSLAIGTTNFFVAQRTDSLFNNSAFVGCLSGFVNADITQFGDPDGPVLNYLGNALPDGGEAGIWEQDLDAVDFTITTPSNGDVYKWYQSDVNGNITNPISIFEETVTGSASNATGEDLRILTQTNGIIFFKVSLTNNIIAGEFEGCESEIADRTLVQLNIFDTPAEPFFNPVSQDNYISNATNPITNFYFSYDTAANYTAQLTGGTIDVEGLNVNVADNPGTDVDESDLTNIQPIEYNWYYPNAATLALTNTTGSATLAALTVNNDLPGDGTGADNPTAIETYSLTVSQSQFDGQNFNPTPAESTRRTVNLNIIPVPDTPSPTESLIELCEDEAVSTLSITNRFAGAQVHWFNEDPRVNPNADTLNNVDVQEFTYTPNEVENNPGTYTYYVRQSTSVGINGSDFQGSLSDVATVQINVYPTADVPTSTASEIGGIETYQYCLGDPIENLQIASPAADVDYRWYTTQVPSDASRIFEGSSIPPINNPAFDETLVGTYNYYVTATLAGEGCESDAKQVRIIINEIPDPEIEIVNTAAPTGFEDLPEIYEICVDEAPFELFGNSVDNVFGTFTGPGVTNGTNGQATFDPLAALGITDPLDFPEFESETVTITYTLTNDNNCVDAISSDIVIHALPRPNFSVEAVLTGGQGFSGTVIEPDAVSGGVCIDLDPNNSGSSTSLLIRTLRGAQTGSITIDGGDPIAVSQGVVTINTETLNALGDPSVTSHDHIIRFEFTNENGCTNFIEKTLTIHENPKVAFDYNVGCEGEPITLEASAVAPFTNTDIETYNWAYATLNGSSVDVSTFPNGGASFTSVIDNPAEYIVTVLAESANIENCVSIVETDVDSRNDRTGNTQRIPIGDTPEVDFFWQRITEGRPLTLSGRDANILDFNRLAEASVDWGDGNTTALSANTAADGPAFADQEHIYANDGWYEATVTLITENGCDNSATKTIKVLPFIAVDPVAGHLNNFEAATEEEAGWFVDDYKSGTLAPEDQITSWSYRDLTNSGFDANDGHGWTTATSAENGYIEDDSSWVYSPAFDISALARPMVVFDGLYDFQPNDGAVLEYSIDNGDSWQILGRHIPGDDQGTGIYWYNVEDIRSDPGTQRGSGSSNDAFGWGGDEVDPLTEAASIRHKLDEIPDPSFVRFRFNFASTASALNTGFAFDNFSIVERDKIALIEQFSNSNGQRAEAQASRIVNEKINSRLDSALQNNGDLVAINYYTDVYGNDPLYEVNTEGPNARSTFYGIQDITSILDGNVTAAANASVAAQSPPWSAADANRNVLRPADVDIELFFDQADDEDEITVNADITLRDDLDAQDVRVYFAVIEKILTGNGVPLPNNESDVRNVFRQFLPNPQGVPLENKQLGSTTTITENWTVDARKVVDPDNLAVVVFVQDVGGSKEVYQAARIDVNGKLAVTGIENLIEIEDLNIYPNPANESFTVTFDRTLEEDFHWVVFDQSGRRLLNGDVNKGQDGFKVNTMALPSGVYIFSIGNTDKQYTYQRIIVRH